MTPVATSFHFSIKKKFLKSYSNKDLFSDINMEYVCNVCELVTVEPMFNILGLPFENRGVKQ